MYSIRKISGYTLLELMVTVALVGVISAAAAPNVASFLDRRGISQQSTVIADAFSLARASALSNGLTSQVCWNTGAGGGNLAALNSIVVIGDSSAVPPVITKSVVIQPDGFSVNTTAVPGNCLTFDEQGRASDAVSFGVCKEDGDVDELITVTLAATGRPTILRANPQAFTCT